MRNILATLLALLGLSLAAGADPYSGPGRLTVMSEKWGTVYCLDSCSYSRDPRGFYTVTTPTGTIKVSRQGEWTVVQFPGHTARVRDDGGGKFLVQFLSVNYRFERKAREFLVNLKDEMIVYGLSSGKLRNAVGQLGSFTVRTHGNAYEVESPQAGVSTYHVRTRQKPRKGQPGQYEFRVLEGPDADKHPYLVRGFIFQDASVGIYIPLHAGPLTEALAWQNTKTILGPNPAMPPKPDPYAETPTLDPNAGADPLKAVVRGPDDPDPLKVLEAPKSEDALKFNSKSQRSPKPAEDPLKANVIPPGQDKLKVKEFNPDEEGSN